MDVLIFFHAEQHFNNQKLFISSFNISRDVLTSFPGPNYKELRDIGIGIVLDTKMLLLHSFASVFVSCIHCSHHIYRVLNNSGYRPV
jgi:hypothetical protein